MRLLTSKMLLLAARYLLPCCCVYLCTSYVQAEQDVYRMSLEQLRSVKVTSPAKRMQSIIEAPSSITVINRDEFEDLGLTTLEELLNYVSGVEYHREGLESLVTFRGRRAVGSDILVLLDGMRLNDPVSASAFLSFQNISLFSIDKVEVIKGPGSALYGSNAYNGVISLTSRKEVNRTSVSAGSLGAIKGQLALYAEENDWILSLNAEKYKDDGQHYPAFFDFFGSKEPTQDPMSGHHVYAHGQYKKLSAKIGRHTRLSEDFVWVSQGNDINYFKIDSEYVALSYDYDYASDLKVNFAFEQVDSTQSVVLLQLPAEVASVAIWTNGDVIPFIGGNYREVKSQRYHIDASWTQSEESAWQFGLEHRQESTDEITFQGNWDPAISRESNGLSFVPRNGSYTRLLWWFGSYQPLVPESKRNIDGVYVQNTLKWGEDWQLTVGGRFDDYEDVGSNVSFRGGITHQLSTNSTLKMLYGEAFRAPTLFELNALIATGLIGNPDLKPETVKTIDLVWMHDWGKVQSSLTYYRSEFDDVIEPVLVEDIIDGFASFQPQNHSGLDLSGWEVELKSQMSDAWSSRVTFAQSNEYVELGAAKSNASISVNYSNQHWNFNLSSVYHSDVLSRESSDIQVRGTKLKSFWLTKSHLRYSWSENVDLSLIVDNIFNEPHTGYSPINGLEHGSPHRDRTWNFSINAKF